MRTLAVSMLVVASALMLAACSKKASEGTSGFQRVKLPGFSVELPAGSVTTTSKTPSNGTHEVKLPESNFLEVITGRARRGGQAKVEWNSQAYSEDEWRTYVVPMMMRAFQGDRKAALRLLKSESVSPDRWLYVAGDSKIIFALGAVNCDALFSIMITYFGSLEVEHTANTMRHMVESVSCAVTEENRERPLGATRLPAKFGYTPEQQVQIFQALDGEQVLINFTRSDIQRERKSFRTMMRALVGGMVGEEIPDTGQVFLPPGKPDPGSKSSLMRFDLQNGERIYIGTTWCPAVNRSMFTMAWGPEVSDAVARERQAQVSCPGGESTPSPPFEELANAACRAGSREFCGLRQLPE